MNRAQKIAWLFVVTTSLAVIITAVTIPILYFKLGWPRALAGFAFMGISGLGGLGSLIFKKDKGSVTCDERDRLINQRAALAGLGSSYLFVGLTCMIPFFVLGPKASISVTWLPMIFIVAGITHFFAHSVAILVQYGWRDKDESK